MSTVTVYKTLVQIGYQKAGAINNKGQLISAFYGSPETPDVWNEIELGKGLGADLHARTKKAFHWWMAEIWLAEGDLLKISTKVATAGVGKDEDRTMDMLFALDPSAGVVQVTWRGLGYKEFPLAKGCLREISRSSAANARMVKVIQPLLDEAGEAMEIER